MLNVKDLIYIIINTAIVFTFIFILGRILGKKQMSQLTFYNYISGITLGSITAKAVDIKPDSTIDQFIVLACWVLFTIIAGYVSLKVPVLRTVLDGEPAIVIKKGKISYKTLKKLLLNIDDLTMLLREKDVFSIKEVEYAILEPDGKLSVLKKEREKQLTKKDMNINVKDYKFIPTEIIVDGTIIKRNLKELNITENWVISELNKQNIKSYKDVLYAELQKDKSLYVDKKRT